MRIPTESRTFQESLDLRDSEKTALSFAIENRLEKIALQLIEKGCNSDTKAVELALDYQLFNVESELLKRNYGILSDVFERYFSKRREFFFLTAIKRVVYGNFASCTITQ